MVCISRIPRRGGCALRRVVCGAMFDALRALSCYALGASKISMYSRTQTAECGDMLTKSIPTFESRSNCVRAKTAAQYGRLRRVSLHPKGKDDRSE